jgi:hypothetical protein
MIIGDAFVPEVPIVPVEVAVALVRTAAFADGAARTDTPVLNKIAAVKSEINFFNMRDPLDVTS